MVNDLGGFKSQRGQEGGALTNFGSVSFWRQSKSGGGDR